MPTRPSVDATINRRERARARAKRYGRFLRDATAGLKRSRDRRKKLHAALITASNKHALLQQALEGMRTQLAQAELNGETAHIHKLQSEIQTKIKGRGNVEERMDHLQGEIDKENAQVVKLRLRAKRAFTKRRFFLKRARFLAVKVRRLKELREQREKEQPTFEPWMANGADYQNASDGAKAFIARAVVIHGLVCTSMARTYVPPGGSTVSYHLLWNGGRAGDAAGSMERMEACQEAEYERGKGLPGQLEMFGPRNDLNLKRGAQLVQAEGSANEDLHDDHNHCAEEDSALYAAIQR